MPSGHECLLAEITLSGRNYQTRLNRMPGHLILVIYICR